MPSRMSCSETSTPATPRWRDDLLEHEHAAADHIGAARMHERQRATLLPSSSRAARAEAADSASALIQL